MQLFANNAISTLAAGITAAATSIQLAAGEGTKFPSPANGDYFLATLFQRGGSGEYNWEIVMCTSRTGDVLTVVRAQEGTTAKPYNAGDPIENRLVAGSFVPARANALTGPLNEAVPVTMASASSMSIGTAGSNNISVTGTTQINAFDAIAAGARRRLTFAGVLTLAHNSAAIRNLTSANIVTKAGDSCEFQSLGGGVWQMLSYSRLDGRAVAEIASSQVTAALGFTPLDASRLGAASGAAPLDASSKVPVANLPNTDAITEGDTYKFFTEGRVRTAALAGISFASAAAIVATDSVLGAFGKLQKQITDLTSSKANLASPTFTGSVGGITKAMVGLGSADDTADADKPVSGPQQTALNQKAPKDGAVLTNPTFTNYVEKYQKLTAVSGTLSPTLADGTLIELSISGNVTINLPAPVAGKGYTIVIHYTGAYTPTFVPAAGTTLGWFGKSTGSNTAPIATMVTGKRDAYSFVCVDGHTCGRDAGRNG